MARAAAAVERGQAATAIDQLAPLLRNTGSLSRADELVIRSALAEAYLLQGDLTQASTAVGRSPDTIREPIPPVILSNLWRAHGRVAFARGEQSRAIALAQPRAQAGRERTRLPRHRARPFLPRPVLSQGRRHVDRARAHRRGRRRAARRRRSALPRAGAFAVGHDAGADRPLRRSRRPHCARPNASPPPSRPTTCSRRCTAIRPTSR